MNMETINITDWEDFQEQVKQVTNLPWRTPKWVLDTWQDNQIFPSVPFCTSCLSLCQKLTGLISLKRNIKTWVSTQRFPSLLCKYKHFTLTKKKKKKKSNEEHCSQPSRLITSLNLLVEKEHSKLKREKIFSQQDFHHRITHRWKTAMRASTV